MEDQYFGTKGLYEVVLKANTSMKMGPRNVEVGEPVLYFNNISIAQLNEDTRPIMARGGWGNMPHVIWEDRAEMTFVLSEGVMNAVSMGILMSALMLENKGTDALYIPKAEGPFDLDRNNSFFLQETPAEKKKAFCFEYSNDVPQKKINYQLDGKRVTVPNGDRSKTYFFDYYYRYGKEAITYLIEKERFNGTFSLEGKFYTKDENVGLNTTNILYMPKVRIMSNINLRLGERADPTVAVFNIIAMPQMTEDSRYELMKIIRLGEDIDGDI